MSEEEASRFEYYALDFESSRSDLFLAEMCRKKRIEPDSAFELFRTPYEFLIEKISCIRPNRPNSNAAVYSTEADQEAVSKLLASFDTGISKISFRQIGLEELSSMVPAKVLQQIREDFESLPAEDEKGVAIRSQNVFAIVTAKGSEEPKISVLKTEHSGSFYDFDFTEESDGTKRLFDYLDMLLNTDGDAVYLIDEIDRSLHPMLTQHLISEFNERHSDDDRTQLIFTTHEASLMSDDLLRKDEIWFVDRDCHGHSKLYPLDRFKERSDASVSRAYFNGRYGGIPALVTVRTEPAEGRADASAQ